MSLYPDNPLAGGGPTGAPAEDRTWRVEVERDGDEIIGPVRLFTGPTESWEIQGTGDSQDDEWWANLLADKHNAALAASPGEPTTPNVTTTVWMTVTHEPHSDCRLADAHSWDACGFRPGEPTAEMVEALKCDVDAYKRLYRDRGFRIATLEAALAAGQRDTKYEICECGANITLGYGRLDCAECMRRSCVGPLTDTGEPRKDGE